MNHFLYSNCSNFGIFGNGSVVESFRFQMFGLIPIHKPNILFLDVLRKHDRFIYKRGHKTVLTSEKFIKPNNLNKPNVRYSASYCSQLFSLMKSTPGFKNANFNKYYIVIASVLSLVHNYF